METEPQLKVSSDRLVKLGIKPATPGLEVIKFEYSLKLKRNDGLLANTNELQFYNLDARFTRKVVYPLHHSGSYG